jgi:solute carrier family 25 folate transporter 32
MKYCVGVSLLTSSPWTSRPPSTASRALVWRTPYVCLPAFLRSSACRPAGLPQIVRTRLQTQVLHGERGEGMAVVLRGIVRDEGWLALYKGLGASTLGLSHIAIQFPVYEWLKRSLSEYARASDAPRTRLDARLSRRGSQTRASGGVGTLSARESSASCQRAIADEPQPVWAVLVASSISKLLASAATYPHELVRARLQDQRKASGSSGARYAGIIDVLRQTMRTEGVGALWHGFSVNLVRAVPQSMITFGMYEWLIYNI